MKITDLTPRSALELAASIEDRAAARYRALAEKFSDHEALAEVFTQLARDEAAHGSHFNDLVGQLPDEGAFEGPEQALDLLRASAASEFFRPDALAVDDVETPADALHKALGLEKATLFFYQSLKDVLLDTREVEHLIETEKRHVSALMKVLVSDAKFRGLDDTW